MDLPDNNNQAVKTIDDILVSGLITDVFNAERYNMMFKILCDHSTKLNKSAVDIQTFFSSVQGLSQNGCILALARVYDKASDKYPTRSLPYLFKKLRELAPQLPKVEENKLTLKILKQYNVSQECCDALVDAARFPVEVANYFENLCKNNNSLKEFRDKIIAHNEAFDEKPALTWKEFEELAGLAKQVIEIIGMAYFSGMYQGTITKGAERNAISTEAVLRRLGITEDLSISI
jgi:hypothetical protein